MGPFLLSKRAAATTSVVIFLVLAAITMGVGAWYYSLFSASLTEQGFSHVQTLEQLAAKATALRLDELVGYAQSYANQPAIQDAVANGAWDRGIAAIETLLKNPSFYDPAVDRIFLIGLDGKINGAFPGVVAANIGTIDGGYETWKAPLLADHRSSYISNVVLRSVSPRINVIKILIPVSKNSSPVGVIRFDVPINEFSNLGKDANLTSDGFVYFTDGIGQIVSHPKISSDWPIVSFASVPSVDRALHGQAGADTLYNALEQQERVTAYGQVPGYGWVVVAQEPMNEAFANRNAILNRIGIMVVLTLIIEAALAFALFFRENAMNRRQQP